MISLYNTLIHYPLVNLLVGLYNTVAFADLGIAIILLTLLVRLLLFPIFERAARYQAVMQAIQPKLKKIQENHKNDKEEQVKATMALYREHNINPFAGIGLILLQLPILIALFHILRTLNPADLGGLYSFVERPENLNTFFLGLINVQERNILIVGIAALTQYFHGRTMLKKPAPEGAPNQAEQMGRMMVTLGPLLTVFILWGLPSAIGLYWATTSAFSIVQQQRINKALLHHGTVGNIRGTTD